MASFTFDLDGTKVTGYTEKIQLTVNFTYRAKAKCPFCTSEYKAGYNPGEKKTESDVKSMVKTGLKRHYAAIHKGKGFPKTKTRKGW